MHLKRCSDMRARPRPRVLPGDTVKAIDSSTKTTGMAQAIAAAGFGAVGVYLRPDRCTAAMIAELHGQNLKVWTVYEKGYPTSDGYFTAAKGDSDGRAAAKFAADTIGQPKNTQIYAAVDYDAGLTAVNGPISDYMRAFQAAVAAKGYQASVYGSGRTCRILQASGLAVSGWLTQSTGFAEYAAYKPKAAIVQLPRINNSWDGDDIPNPLGVGLW